MSKFTLESEYDCPDFLFRVEGDSEGWTKTALFRVDTLKDEFIDPDDITEKDLCEVAIDSLGWYEYYGSPGRPFAHYPCAKVEGKSKKWVRVVQSGGLDI